MDYFYPEQMQHIPSDSRPHRVHCATAPDPVMQQPSSMLPAYTTGPIPFPADIPAGFYANYPFSTSMMPPYSSPVSSLYQPPSFADIGLIAETSPPSDPSQKHRSPEEEHKYRQKRLKNNEAAKASRRKRTDREKTLQQANEQLRVLYAEATKKLQEVMGQLQVCQAENAHLRMMKLNDSSEDKENHYFQLSK